MKSNIAVKYPDILILPENKLGEDFIIGDVHGHFDLLEKVASYLSENDRLFIVGDLIDKGPRSKDVVKLINEHKPEGGKKPAIYVVCGNHDEAFKKHALRQSISENVLINDSWVGSRHSGTNWIKNLSLTEVQEIYAVLKSLPYIIHVMGKTPFNIVHADMPFDDDELWKRVKLQQSLSSQEIEHATDARACKPNTKMTFREVTSAITYCGHDFIIDDITKIIRTTSKTLNLDVAAYDINCFVAVRHKAGTAFSIGEPFGKEGESIADILHIINNYLKRNEKHVIQIIDRLKLLLQIAIDKDMLTLAKGSMSLTQILVISLNKIIPKLCEFQNGERKQPELLQDVLFDIDETRKLMIGSRLNLLKFFRAKDALLNDFERIETDLLKIQKIMHFPVFYNK